VGPIEREELSSMGVELKGLSWWRTEHLLIVYERLFGDLEPQTKQRMLETARAHGWDRTWDQRAA